MERRDARERSKALSTLETVQQLFEPPENAAILAFSFLAPSLALGLGDPVACVALSILEVAASSPLM